MLEFFGWPDLGVPTYKAIHNHTKENRHETEKYEFCS
jgi:hypothetical protein